MREGFRHIIFAAENEQEKTPVTVCHPEPFQHGKTLLTRTPPQYGVDSGGNNMVHRNEATQHDVLQSHGVLKGISGVVSLFLRPAPFRHGLGALLCLLWFAVNAVPVVAEETTSLETSPLSTSTGDGTPAVTPPEVPPVPEKPTAESASTESASTGPDASQTASDSEPASPAEKAASSLLSGQLPPPPPPPRWSFNAETMPPWQKLDSGLELGLFPGRTGIGQALQMVILRIDPREYAFSVLTVASDEESRSLGNWAVLNQLVAVINASMYLPDGRTSTGYLRSGHQVNNERIVTRFGAFFVAGPDSEDLPGAALLDRTEDPWEKLLPRYSMVVQNYRLISAGRRLLWNPGGPKHSIAAVGRDGTGALLFIHCREPLTGVDFGMLLLALPIDIRLVMYVEGGSQAGLLIQTPTLQQTWMGRHPADIWTAGNEDAPLPNVIGIRKRR